MWRWSTLNTVNRSGIAVFPGLRARPTDLTESRRAARGGPRLSPWARRWEVARATSARRLLVAPAGEAATPESDQPPPPPRINVEENVEIVIAVFRARP